MHPVLVCGAGGVTEPWPKQGLTRCLASICGAKDGKLLSLVLCPPLWQRRALHPPPPAQVSGANSRCTRGKQGCCMAMAPQAANRIPGTEEVKESANPTRTSACAINLCQ